MSFFIDNHITISRLISWHASWREAEPAIIFNHKQTSWLELHLRTNQLANVLLDKGLNKGQRVVILMENSASMLIAMFATLKAGLSVVPINLNISDETLFAQVNDAKASAIIASEQQAQRINSQLNAFSTLQTFLKFSSSDEQDNWQSLNSLLVNASMESPSVTINRDDECIVIYSSGTTGIPKGIVHNHGARLDWAYDLSIALKFHSGATTICSLGLYSNISWVSMLTSLLTGGKLIIQEKFSAEEFIQLVDRYQVTHCAGVPIQYQRVFDNKHFSPKKVRSLTMLMCCGSAMSDSLKRLIGEHLECDLIELYGLTEGVITTLAPEYRKRKPNSVGKPLPGLELAILSDEDKMLDNHEPGEIISRGRTMMVGYLNRADADKSASWQDIQGKVWFRTGDIGKIDKDGFLYLVDRKKDMIISGGQNIYPQDLEKILLQHNAIDEAAVIGVTSEKWGETPLALVVSKVSLDLSLLCDWANKQLGRQQKIAKVEQVTSLPRNPNGKLEKKKIRDSYAHYQL
ncbi:acyl--CoA ligase [Aliikangiella marina]|uniref:Acyl--CoA ligase n=1 Tax=Aliikangiella marina TaxID=1712262 RepID=A0A545T8T7_9GAMM|nr:class I adenylate-forming enzyme family protein [Aliikangiella marina]TQV73634.1 acyl--CoA ligase [Aliikangiella marina]